VAGCFERGNETSDFVIAASFLTSSATIRSSRRTLLLSDLQEGLCSVELVS
jgi:hypothetical protein